jgi:anaerobic magnesium-protoporphyrin IX monomethyl ester cyclase
MRRSREGRFSGLEALRVLFVEPPKDFWFIMGEYVPPPFGILALAGYVEAQGLDLEIGVVDCQAEGLDWKGLERRIEGFQPDVVAPSALSTSNAYAVLRTAELAKEVDPGTLTVVGGQHFTALAEESLRGHPVIDFVVRGEGEETLAELLEKLVEGRSPGGVRGLSLRDGDGVVHNPDRPLIEDLDSLPMPGYRFVEEHMGEYYFALMAEREMPFAIVEGSRGCRHDCSYCSQWRFWRRNHRAKSPGRIADEIEHIHRVYGSRFFWLTDDNLGLGERTEMLCDELIRRGMGEEVSWFCQARCDDIAARGDLLPKLRESGNVWMLVGFDSPNPETLDSFRRTGIDRSKAREATDLLRRNDIFTQGTFIIGERRDSHESIKALREFADQVDPDIATFMTLTPFPGTEIYETAKREGWIKDTNWGDYDMIHAIMPTEHLTREEVQEELYECYREFFGSWPRRYRGFFSSNEITKRTYQYLSRKAILAGLRSLF